MELMNNMDRNKSEENDIRETPTTEPMIASPRLDAQRKSKVAGRVCTKLWLNPWREFVADVRSIRWRRVFGWFIVLIWMSALCITLTMLALLPELFEYDSACQPDDTFDYRSDTFSFWSASGFFQITLGFGSLSFTQAKAIDVVWDVVYGRGGQALLAWVSYKAFKHYLTVCMEITPVTYSTFRAIFLDHSSSIRSIYRVVRDFAFRLALPSKVAMGFMVTTMAFILAFPTFASAMTGYASNVKAFVPDQSSNLVPFSEFARALYLIHDGQRINKTANYVVTSNLGGTDPSDLSVDSRQSCMAPNESTIRVPSACYESSNASFYFGLHGFTGTRDTPTKFMGIELDAPALNITPFEVTDSIYYWSRPSIIGQPLLPPAWVYQNRVYDGDSLLKTGTCQAVSGSYRWGFSCIQLGIMVAMLIVWTIGLCVMWIQVQSTMQRRGRTDVAGDHKAVLELAESLRRNLSQYGHDPATVAEEKIDAFICKQMKGGAMSYQMPLKVDGFSMRQGLKSWIMREKWWMVILIVVLLLTLLVGLTGIPIILFWSVGPMVGIIVATQVGSTLGSRVWVIFFFSLLSAVAALPPLL